jgi:hypothetical protein
MTPLHYKVVELSTVDEGTLESTVNHWVRQGWNLDGVQFAMRESSKRPSMAFVFFTRSDLEAPAHDEEAARAHLRRIATEERTTEKPRTADPWQRLAELAGEAPVQDDEDNGS